MRIGWLAGVLAGIAVAGPAAAGAGLSGLAQLDGNTYVGVFDDKRIESGKRIALVRFDANGVPTRDKLSLSEWRRMEARPSDLEAACALGGRTGEALVLESGNDGSSAQLFHVAGLSTGGKAHVLRALEVPAASAHQNLEGLACTPLRGGGWLLLLGERGGSDHHPAGLLRWATLAPDASALTWTAAGKRGLSVEGPPGWGATTGARAITDLAVDRAGVVWAAATHDPGDAGPFDSAVYALADLHPDAPEPVALRPHPQATWRIAGFKVEGLAAPPAALADDAALIVATEDEDLGGAIRALPKIRD